MASIEMIAPSFIDRAVAFCLRFGQVLVARSTASDTPEQARARRACMQDMLSRSPEAFASDFDVQSMFQYESGSY